MAQGKARKRILVSLRGQQGRNEERCDETSKSAPRQDHVKMTDDASVDELKLRPITTHLESLKKRETVSNTFLTFALLRVLFDNLILAAD